MFITTYFPEGETKWENQQHTQVAEGDQTVTVDFEDVVKNKTISELRLWAPEKGIQILLKKVWLIKNDNTLEEQKFSLLWGGLELVQAGAGCTSIDFPYAILRTVCL